MDSRIISLDIETFPNVKRFADGRPTPPRPARKEAALFHARRSILQTPVAQQDLVVSCAITLGEHPCQTPPPGTSSSGSSSSPSGSSSSLSPSPSSSCIDGLTLSRLTPGVTFYFLLHRQDHRHLLHQWLAHAHTILGKDLHFDITHLRTDPLLRTTLTGRHQLIDLSVINYLHNELRPERSLKNLGPVLGTHVYSERTLLEQHPSPVHASHQSYNCEDSHNTVLATAHLARQIFQDFPSTDKLSSFCLSFYSDILWCCIHMEESGVPLHRASLEALEARLQRISSFAEKRCRDSSLLLSGKGSALSKTAFLNRLVAACPNILNEPLLGFTKVKHDIQFTDSNRSLFRLRLPPQEIALLALLRNVNAHARSEKILSSFTFPLLRHNRNRPWNTTSILLPQPSAPDLDPSVQITYPLWYPVPSAVKDSGGDEGGTTQSRPAAKKPSYPTFPPDIQECQRSRFRNGVLLKMDLSQNELRAGGLLSGEPLLLNAFTLGWDIHARTALDMWSPLEIHRRYPSLASAPIDQYRSLSRGFKKREGQVGKRINFSAFFRAGALKMAMSVLGDIGEVLPLQDFQRMVELRPRRMPILWEWQRQLIRTCHGFSLFSLPGGGVLEVVEGDHLPHNASFLRHIPGTGYLHLPFTGQSRWFMGGDKYDISEIVNFPIQTTAANLLWRIQSRLLNLLSCLLSTPRVLLYGNIYDACAFDCRSAGDADRLEAHIRDAVDWVARSDYWKMLQDHYQRSVPLAYEVTRSDKE